MELFQDQNRAGFGFSTGHYTLQNIKFNQVLRLHNKV